MAALGLVGRRRPRFGTWLLLMIAFAAALLSTQRADAFVYWTTGTGKVTSAIGRASLNGSGVDEAFANVGGGDKAITGDPTGLTVDAGHIYWSNFDRDTIGRAKIDGTGPDLSFIANLSRPNQLAVDSGHLFWTSYFKPGFGPSRAVSRSNLDGSSVVPFFVPSVVDVYDVAVDATHVYWASDSGIGRAKLDGSAANPSFINLGFSLPLSLAVGAGHIYWQDASGAAGVTIGRANLNGSGVNQAYITGFSDLSSPHIAVDAGHIYWTDEDKDTIGRANLDGTGFNGSFIKLDSEPHDVAVDALVPVAGKVKANPNQVVKPILVKLKIIAREQLRARASGVIKTKRPYKLKPVTVDVAPGRSKTLKLRLKGRQAAKVAAALKRGKKATARLEVELTGQAGNSSFKSLKVNLRRR